MLIPLSLSGCAPRPEPTPPPIFAPVAVGVGFDGVVTADGALSGYSLGGSAFAPSVALQFVSEAFAEATDPTVREIESCLAVTTFEPPPLLPPEQIPTEGGLPLLVSYDTALSLEATSCIGRADPEIWGEEAEALLDPFEGIRFGVGFGPLTEGLRGSWSAETLEDLGASMLAMWVAIEGADGEWIASDWTTAVAFEWDPQTGEATLAPSESDGELDLVPLAVDALSPGAPLPPMYLQSYPLVYRELSLLGLEGLSE